MDLNTLILALLVPAIVYIAKQQRDQGITAARTETKVDGLTENVRELRKWRHSIAQVLQERLLDQEIEHLEHNGRLPNGVIRQAPREG